jgi:hypothetical protein
MSNNDNYANSTNSAAQTMKEIKIELKAAFLGLLKPEALTNQILGFLSAKSPRKKASAILT